jgi:Domain of unknown function (DUF4439)
VSPRAPDSQAVAALQDALAAEHAAVWAYTLAVAFLPADMADRARADAEAHRKLRAAVEATVSQLGERPVAAQPAYTTPQPVVDAGSAAALAEAAETDTMAAWRSVMERTTTRDVRAGALETLATSTVRCSRWRATLGSVPAIPAFPGR